MQNNLILKPLVIALIGLSVSVTATAAPKVSRNAGYNQSLKILQALQKNENELTKAGKTVDYPRLEWGGSISVDLANSQPFVGPTTQDFNLSGATLNLGIDVNKITDAYVALTYEGGPFQGTLTQSADGIATQPVLPTSVPRIANSRIFLSKGFLTFGNLNLSPYYLSLGQMSTPFGEYASNILTPPFTARIGRINQRVMLLGFQQPCTNTGFNASVFAFRSDTKIGSTSQRGFISNGGANVGYDYVNGKFKLNTGVSAVANIADAGGMQNTNAPFVGDDQWWYDPISDDEEFEEFIPATTFAGFGRTSESEVLEHRVPGADVRAKATYDAYYVQAEYTASTRPFAVSNLSFNEHGAKPRAFDAQAGMNFKVMCKDAAVAIDYGQTWEALGLTTPRYRYAAAGKLTPYKNVNLGLEYRIDQNYPIGSTTTGQGLTVGSSATPSHLGKTARNVVLQAGISF